MKRIFTLSFATLALCLSFSTIGCGGSEESAPLDITEEDKAIEEESASGMEDAMKGMGKKK